ncbi:hypothetical protein ACQ4WX_22485 [Streptomyces lasalocidi]|uniref:hypothetical protein n=1 Tax=Streptomyces sp. MUSC 14 TaxID=1354889 RepID=UPI0015A52C76|nr:hypothetical protein [Streptomyces sp. MUSC 14]
MSRTKKILATAALVLGATAAAVSPALANTHATITTPDNTHATIVSPDNTHATGSHS